MRTHFVFLYVYIQQNAQSCDQQRNLTCVCTIARIHTEEAYAHSRARGGCVDISDTGTDIQYIAAERREDIYMPFLNGVF